MSRESTLAALKERRISAIIRTSDRDLARDAMQAVVDGGIRAVEFTLTTPGALELVSEFRDNSELIVGAGTVMTTGDVEAAAAAGAQFIVSPVFDAAVIRAAREHDLVSIPGTFTATEMQAAHEAGADMVKLFPGPADVADYVRSILGPLPHLKIFPTNGITAENFLDVLAAGAAGVGLVRALFDPEAMAARDFAAIERRASHVCGLLAEFTAPVGAGA